MTEHDLTLAVARANRQAAAMVIHFARSDAAGFNAIVEELESGADVRNLILGILALFRSVLPVLMSPAGIALVESVIADLAADEHGGPA